MRGVGTDPADPLYVRAMASLGRAIAFTGAIDPAGALGRRAIELARASGDDDLLAHALQASLWQGLRPHDATDKLARATELTRLAHRTGDLGHLVPAAVFRGSIGYLQGDPAGMAEAYDDLVLGARVTGQGYFAYFAGCMQYARSFAEGDLDGARRICGELEEWSGSFGADDTGGSSAVQAYMIRRESGALEQVRSLISGEERPGEHWAPGLLALYTELGLGRSAGRLLHWLLDGRLGRYQESAQWPCVLAFATEAALALGDEPAARTLRPMLEEYRGLNLVVGQFVAVFGSADRYCGAVDSLLGEPGAEERLAAAVAMDARMAAPLHHAYSLAATARHLRRVGAGARADEVAEEARALAGSPDVVRLRRVLEPAPEQKPAPPARPGGALPAGLTVRETEVLRLLAEGLLNREIAERLVISENTAANHVRSILAKTGSGNRTQAAMFAAAHRLLD